MRLYILCLALLLTSGPASAWNAAGHRIVARIAWLELSPGARSQINALLSQHPDYGNWQNRVEATNEDNAFIEASTWPDDIRNDPRFFDEGDEPTRLPPGFSDTSRHKRWHYLDLPLSGGANLGDGELEQQLPRLIHTLRHSRSSTERAYVLPWVIHLVGDAHQPLHVASRNDEGGNRFELEDPFNPRLPFTNLHRWWDDRPGPPWLRGQRLERAAARLLREYPDAPASGEISVWLQESRLLAARYGYPPEVGSLLPIISEVFRQQAEAITGRQLAAAGKRLGQLLEAIFAPVSRGTP